MWDIITRGTGITRVVRPETPWIEPASRATTTPDHHRIPPCNSPAIPHPTDRHRPCMGRFPAEWSETARSHDHRSRRRSSHLRDPPPGRQGLHAPARRRHRANRDRGGGPAPHVELFRNAQPHAQCRVVPTCGGRVGPGDRHPRAPVQTGDEAVEGLHVLTSSLRAAVAVPELFRDGHQVFRGAGGLTATAPATHEQRRDPGYPRG